MYWAYSELVWYRSYQDWRFYTFLACQLYLHWNIRASNFWYRWNQTLRVLSLKRWWLDATKNVLIILSTCLVQEISRLEILRIFGMSTVSPLAHSCFEPLLQIESDAADNFIRQMMIRCDCKCTDHILNLFGSGDIKDWEWAGVVMATVFPLSHYRVDRLLQTESDATSTFIKEMMIGCD
jgi:hypothetical protein